MTSELPSTVAWWRRPVWVTAQSWTSLAASAVFLAMVMVLVLVPAPYVVWGPGGTVDTFGQDQAGTPLVEVSGVETHPTTGELDLTTVSVTRADSRLGFAPAVLAWLRRGFDALDRDLYYPPGTSAEQNEQELAAMMSQSQLTARIAAARAAGIEVEDVVLISLVVIGGPSDGDLQPGDVVLAVDGHRVATAADAEQILTANSHDQVTWLIRRDGQERTMTTRLRAGSSISDRTGAALMDGHDTALTVRFGIDEAIGGPSAGLVFALAIYDLATPGELLAGRHVAGTGTITADGTVGSIGGIQSKIVAAERAGAEIFLVPADNCADLAGIDTDMILVRVATLDEAIHALSHPDQEVPPC